MEVAVHFTGEVISTSEQQRCPLLRQPPHPPLGSPAAEAGPRLALALAQIVTVAPQVGN